MASRIVPEGGHRLKPFKTPRQKKPAHLVFVKSLPCVCCAAQGLNVTADDPMHIRTASDMHGKDYTGGGQKSDDRWTLPGCRFHHDMQHAAGNERKFWQMFRIDPFLLALVLWGLSGDTYAATSVVRLHAAGGAP